MNSFEKFVIEHENDDITKLILSQDKWPDIDIRLAADTIYCRKRLKNKVPEWYSVTSLIYPDSLCAEQCSSSETARYKASLARSIIGRGNGRIADLTGGLGIDSWAFSQISERVLYNESKKALYNVASQNFNKLKIDNILISNETIDTTNADKLLTDFEPDLIYIDPARRSSSGKKVFLLEDCSPDVLKLITPLLKICRHILIKLSPMADISMVAERIGRQVREIHIVGSSGECKELLVWIDSNRNNTFRLIVNDSGNMIEIPQEENFEGKAIIYNGPVEEINGKLLIEPGKALMKAGHFEYISKKFNISKLGISTHLYIADLLPMALKGLCKTFRIIDTCPLSSKNIKAVGKQYRNAAVTSKNIPIRSDELSARMKTIEDGRIHIFGTHIDNTGNYLIVTEKV